jgi:hypothetical protein
MGLEFLPNPFLPPAVPVPLERNGFLDFEFLSSYLSNSYTYCYCYYSIWFYLLFLVDRGASKLCVLGSLIFEVSLSDNEPFFLFSSKF